MKPRTLQEFYASDIRWCKNAAYRAAQGEREVYDQITREATLRNINSGLKLIQVLKMPPTGFAMCLGCAIGYVYGDYDIDDPYNNHTTDKLNTVISQVLDYLHKHGKRGTIPDFNDSVHTKLEDIRALVKELNI